MLQHFIHTAIGTPNSISFNVIAKCSCCLLCSLSAVLFSMRREVTFPSLMGMFGICLVILHKWGCLATCKSSQEMTGAAGTIGLSCNEQVRCAQRCLACSVTVAFGWLRKLEWWLYLSKYTNNSAEFSGAEVQHVLKFCAEVGACFGSARIFTKMKRWCRVSKVITSKWEIKDLEKYYWCTLLLQEICIW